MTDGIATTYDITPNQNQTITLTLPNGLKLKVGEENEVTYTNWRGVTEKRHIVPQGLWYGVTEYHPAEQWFIKAYAKDRGTCEGLVSRDFAVNDFHVDNGGQ